MQTLSNPHTIPIAEPEPEPVQRRLSRNLISPNTQNLFTTLINTKTQTQSLIRMLISAKNKIKNKIKNKPQLSTTPVSAGISTPGQADYEIRENTERVHTTLDIPHIVINETKRTQDKPQDGKTWSVDTSQFEVVAAVPTEDDPDIVSAIGTFNKTVNNENPGNELSVFTAVEAVPSNTEGTGRSPKEISDQSNKIVEGLEECQEKCRAQFCSPEEEKRLLKICWEKCIGLCQI